MQAKMTSRRLFVLLVLLLGSAVANATDCGDGGDGSVPNCCYDIDGYCDTVCDTGYGLTAARDRCVKCSGSCLRCDGDSPNTCFQDIEKPVKVQCKVKNCRSCSPKSSRTCAVCKLGYGLDKKGKNCVKCAVDNCNSCSNDYRTCQGCAFGDSKKKPYYGLVVKGKGKKKKYTCVQCPKGCMFCDGGKCRDESPDDNE
jgi:hypothetical protein